MVVAANAGNIISEITKTMTHGLGLKKVRNKAQLDKSFTANRIMAQNRQYLCRQSAASVRRSSVTARSERARLSRDGGFLP